MLPADLANIRGLVGTVGGAVSSLAAATALAGELALNTRVGAIGGVVARLVAVVAKPGVATLLARLWAVARKVAGIAAAVVASVLCSFSLG